MILLLISLITDLLVVEHLLIRVVSYHYQVPESTGAEIMSRCDTFGPFILEVTLALVPLFL